MKSERRHELQRNALAAWLAKIGEQIKPYTNVSLAILVLATLLTAVILYWRRSEAAERTRAWDSVYVALESQDPKELDVVAQQYRGREVGQWAAVLAGDMHLEAGCNELFQNKANAVEDLRKAVESYLLALESASSSPLRERATFGLARAYEALAGTRQSQGELSKAIEQYRKVVQDWPDGTYAVIAQRRLMDLEKPSTKAFYDQFAKYEPKPPVSPGLGTGNIPFDTETLGPDQQLPDLSKILGPNGAEKPGSEGKTPDTGKAETPAPAGSQPAPAAKPEPAKPASAAEAKGAAQGTPEEPKPAESKPAAPAESKAR